MKRRLPLVAIALTASAVSGAATAWGEPALEVSHVVVEGDVRSLDLTLSAPGLPAGAGLDVTSVRVTTGDRHLPASASVSAVASTIEAPTVLLVVDTSGSMRGQALDEAKQALRTFAAEAPTAARLGLLRFSDRPQLLVAPTTDRPRLLGAFNELPAQGETSLNDAVLEGVRVLGAGGDRRMVVLSDGGDTRSRATLAVSLQAVTASGVVVDVIALRTSESVAATLGRLAASGHGVVHRTSSAADLSAALRTSTRAHARQLRVHALVPSDLRGSHTLSIQVISTVGPLTASAAVTLGGATSVDGAATSTSGWGSRRAVTLGCAGIGVGLLLAILALFGGGRQRQRRQVHRLLGRYTTAPVEDNAATPTAVTRSALELADRFAARRGLQDKLAARLDRAAIAMTPGEWLLLQGGAGCATLFLLVLLGSNPLVALGLAVLIGGVVPGRVLASRGKRRQKAFETKLPDMLQMAAGSLSAGYSLAQALDGVVREGSEPMATELGRALAESRLGVPIESTLDAVATRMASVDFGWVVMAIRVQREVGGNLAGILSTVAATMRERAMLRRHVRGLSAEGRLSAYILIGLPIFLGLYMFMLRREYFEPMYTTGAGIGLIAVAVVLLTTGWFFMSRLVKVEV
jgi:tight adherence protein B